MSLTLRKTTNLDREQLKKWIEADPAHRDTTNPDFWLPSKEVGVQWFAVDDGQGTIFYVRAENVLRLHIQFAPPSEIRRTAAAIHAFAASVKDGARLQKYRQLIFDSVYAPLIRFLEKRGFRKSPNEFVADLYGANNDNPTHTSK